MSIYVELKPFWKKETSTVPVRSYRQFPVRGRTDSVENCITVGTTTAAAWLRIATMRSTDWAAPVRKNRHKEGIFQVCSISKLDDGIVTLTARLFHPILHEGRPYHTMTIRRE